MELCLAAGILFPYSNMVFDSLGFGAISMALQPHPDSLLGCLAARRTISLDSGLLSGTVMQTITQ